MTSTPYSLITSSLPSSSPILDRLRPLDPWAVADALWLCSTSPSSPSLLPQTLKLLKSFHDLGGGASEAVLVCVNPETLERTGLLDANKASVAIKRANTSLKFRQLKFNLFREESEGFAKLLVLLLGGEAPAVAAKQALGLIGYFRLDPNRVLDVVLDCLHVGGERMGRVLEELFGKLNKSKLVDLITFKLGRMNKLAEPERHVVFKCVAVLLAKRILDLKDLLPFLGLEEFVKECETADEAISITAPPPRQPAAVMALESASSVAVITPLVTPSPSPDVAVTSSASKGFMLPKLMLACVEVEDGWMVFEELISVLKGAERHAFRSVEMVRAVHLFFMRETDEVLKTSFVPAAKKTDTNYVVAAAVTTPSKSSTNLKKTTYFKITTLDEFITVLCPVFVRLGSDAMDGRTIRDYALMDRVIKLLGRCWAKWPETMLKMLCACVFPVFAMFVESDTNEMFRDSSDFNFKLWTEIFSKMDYPSRFGIYKAWLGAFKPPAKAEMSGDVRTVPTQRREILAARAKVLTYSKYELNRVCSDVEKNKATGLRFARVAHCMPVHALEQMLRSSQELDNLIDAFTEAIRYLTKLEFDIFFFLICDGMCSSRNKVKEDGFHLSDWFAATCRLAGQLLRKFPETDLMPLLDIICYRFVEEKETTILQGLEDLVSSMSGLVASEDYGAHELNCRGGGDVIRFISRTPTEALTSMKTLMKKDSLLKLKSAVGEKTFFAKMLVAIASRRNEMAFEDQKSGRDEEEFGFRKSLPVEFLGHWYDSCTKNLIQFQDFVSSNVTAVTYVKEMPRVQALVQTYGVDVVSAFHLHRSIFSPRKDAKAGSYPNKEEIDTLFVPLVGIDNFNASLYAKFFEYSLFDLSYPKAEYDAEIRRLRELQSPSVATRESIDQVEKLITLLRNELSVQQVRQESAKSTLNNSSSGSSMWFKSSQVVGAFVQYALFPRLLFSQEDALYCAKFMELALLEGIFGENSKRKVDAAEGVVVQEVDERAELYLSHCCGAVILSLTGSTEREARSVGVFVKSVLTWMNTCKAFTADASQRAFVTALHETATKAICNVLKSDAKRQSIVFLNSTMDVFPKFKSSAVALSNVLKSVYDDVPVDLKTLVDGIRNRLAKKIKDFDRPVEAKGPARLATVALPGMSRAVAPPPHYGQLQQEQQQLQQLQQQQQQQQYFNPRLSVAPQHGVSAVMMMRQPPPQVSLMYRTQQPLQQAQARPVNLYGPPPLMPGKNSPLPALLAKQAVGATQPQPHQPLKQQPLQQPSKQQPLQQPPKQQQPDIKAQVPISNTAGQMHASTILANGLSPSPVQVKLSPAPLVLNHGRNHRGDVVSSLLPPSLELQRPPQQPNHQMLGSGGKTAAVQRMQPLQQPQQQQQPQVWPRSAHRSTPQQPPMLSVTPGDKRDVQRIEAKPKEGQRSEQKDGGRNRSRTSGRTASHRAARSSDRSERAGTKRAHPGEGDGNNTHRDDRDDDGRGKRMRRN